MHGAGWCESGLEGLVPYMNALCGFWGWGEPVEGVGDGGGGYPCNLGYFYFLCSWTGLGVELGGEVAGAGLRMNGAVCY